MAEEGGRARVQEDGKSNEPTLRRVRHGEGRRISERGLNLIIITIIINSPNAKGGWMRKIMKSKDILTTPQQ